MSSIVGELTTQEEQVRQYIRDLTNEYWKDKHWMKIANGNALYLYNIRMIEMGDTEKLLADRRSHIEPIMGRKYVILFLVLQMESINNWH